ncbi:MAG: TolC family protein [Longimicrobiales bacterium]
MAPLAAQEVGEELTFDAAVQLALENSPAFLRQLNAVESAEYSERSSFGSAFLPTVNAGLGFNGSTFRRKTAEDNFGNPIGGTDFIENTTSSASQSVSLGGVNLLNIQSWRGYGAARAQTDARVAAVELQAAQLRTAVGQAYWRAVQAEQLIAVEERQLESARQQLAAVRELLRVAARQPTDVLGAELQVAQAEQAVEQARGTARKERLLLKQTMGVALEREFELATSWPSVFDPAELNADVLVRRAIDQGPRLAQEEANVRAAERQLGVARAARYPTISASASWGRSTSAEDYDAFGDLNLPNQSWGFGFNVSLPVFTRFNTSSQVGQRGVDLQNARQTMREARLQLGREVRAALIDLESAYSTVQLAERSAEIAGERLRQGEELYRLGSIGYTELQRMFDDVANAERRVVSAYNQFASALLQLEEKVGGTVRPAR